MEEKSKGAKKFVCKMYKMDHTECVDEVILFSKTGKPEMLQPTSDTLSLQ